MEILERDSGRRLDLLSLTLSWEEASELRDGLNQVLKGDELEHFHVSGEDYSTDIEVRVLPERK
jgi:hypothetical protein